MTNLFVKIIADGTIVPIVLITGYALLFLVPKKGRFEIYARILVAGMTTYLLAKLLASVYQPMGERPFELLGAAPGAFYLNNPGFPSDHALFASFLTFSVWYVTRHRGLTLILAILTLVMCVGRVLALVHTPLDIVGGIAVAAVGSLWLAQADLPRLHQTLAKNKKLVHYSHSKRENVMDESYEEDVNASFTDMSGRQVVQIAGVGLLVGIVTWGLTWLISSYALSGFICGGNTTMQCSSAVQYGEMTASILAAGLGLLIFIRLQVFRPLLVVLAVTISLWGIISTSTSMSWYMLGAMCAVLYMLAYALFAWIVRIRLFWPVVVILLAFVVVVRLMLSA